MNSTVTLEIVMPVPELTAECIVKLINDIGATCLGGYAELDPKYGNGARFVGSLIKIGHTLLTLRWSHEENTLRIYPVELQPNNFMADQFSVTVTGISCGDMAMFKTPKDARDWISTLSSIEQLKLHVNTKNFDGPAIMFLTTT